jgi:hypothetical protein
MERSALFFLTLTACSGDYFMGNLEGGPSEGGSGSESSTDADSGSNMGDGGGLDASEASSDSSTDAKQACPDPNDVEHDGHCYYLDGSKGVCDQGYTLSSNAKLAVVLAANANAWQGKSGRHTIMGSTCVLTKDNVMNYGLLSNVTPFSAGEPVAGGSACWMISPPQMGQNQLTLCESL